MPEDDLMTPVEAIDHLTKNSFFGVKNTRDGSLIFLVDHEHVSIELKSGDTVVPVSWFLSEYANDSFRQIVNNEQ